MTRLERLFTDGGQSPWLDNVRRDWIESGEMQAWVDRGVRGVTSNPTIFQKTISMPRHASGLKTSLKKKKAMPTITVAGSVLDLPSSLSPCRSFIYMRPMRSCLPRSSE